MESAIKLNNDRVREHTSPEVQEKIDRETQENIQRFAAQDPAAIRARIEKLNKEWDAERALRVSSGINILLGLVLSETVDRRWLFLSALSATLLAQQAQQGWCLPMPLFRRLGVRTKKEIEQERDALLKLLEK
jgi:hypothetical protein